MEGAEVLKTFNKRYLLGGGGRVAYLSLKKILVFKVLENIRKTFFGVVVLLFYFLAPILFKRYQNISVCANIVGNFDSNC